LAGEGQPSTTRQTGKVTRMFVKFHTGGGWRIVDAGVDVRHIHQHGRIEVPDGDYDWGRAIADGDLPLPTTGEWADVIVVALTSPIADDKHERPYRLCRWVTWTDHRGGDVLLITDSAVFVCNDRGDTIEALR
jgi:hypothetical protein